MTPKIDISTLQSDLWEAANILWRSPLDRTDWQNYIPPLMFFKRVCDLRDEKYDATVKTNGADIADEHGFQVLEGCHLDQVREKPSKGRITSKNMMRGTEAEQVAYYAEHKSTDQPLHENHTAPNSSQSHCQPAPPPPWKYYQSDFDFVVPSGKVSSLMGICNYQQSKHNRVEDVSIHMDDEQSTEQKMEDKVKQAFRQVGIQSEKSNGVDSNDYSY